MMSYPQRGHGHGHVTLSDFGTGEDRRFNFDIQVG